MGGEPRFAPPRILCGTRTPHRRPLIPARLVQSAIPTGGIEVLEVRIPADLAAFCSRRCPLYTRYSSLRTSNWAAGTEIAAAALGDLALLWQEALESPSPAALSWHLLSRRVARSARGQAADRLHKSLSARQADVVLLRYRLGLTARDAADIMGIAPADVLVASRAALRSPP
ncbi:sigma factor-like helix-turn-helix DNA-binding protein [Streptomyces sp. NBC_01438]|uniref:sigma factor-like helix-turn-helix DNA-binding protein n=1 Tax=Streptomyces sp. NBC_01438 TaxID=2903866 RepID=UPI00352BF19C